MDAYRTRRTVKEDGDAEVPGFGKGIFLDEVHKHGHVLVPGRYVNVEPQEDGGEPFEENLVAPRFQLLAEDE